MLLVGLEVRASYAEVIQIAICEGKAGQNPIHHALETATRVPEAKGHPLELKEAEGSDHRCLLPVLHPHRNLPISFAQVDLRKNCTAAQTVREI
jgi:hypothetical protein